jgi:UDP-N-acetylglucosamine--N-acetylmuramyl-(pentapeptide) pyrophosphoryl-undecaprenol N-acetylglucosamine transferase
VRIVITGGGTGGHLFPGLAVAEELRRRDEAAEVIFIGSEHGIEARVVPKEGYPIKLLRVEGLIGKSAFKKARAAFRMFLSLIDSVKMLKALRPDIVIGTGGYVSFCPVLAASLMHIPTLIMEQNIVPGVASRILARFADVAAVSYHESMSYFARSRVYLTGNPVRASILKGQRLEACRLFSLDEWRFTVFVFGGSQGARSLNNAMVGALNHLLDLKEKVQFLHGSGERDYEHLREAYRKLGFRAAVAPFIYQMAEAYALADVVISRAGATTISEITALGKPSLLIPFPYAAHDHQEFNARKLAELGASRMLTEDALSGEILAAAIRELHGSEELRSEMRKQSRAVGRPDAAQRIADIAQSLIKESEPGIKHKNKGLGVKSV